jgi:hypothetical protein
MIAIVLFAVLVLALFIWALVVSHRECRKHREYVEHVTALEKEWLEEEARRARANKRLPHPPIVPEFPPCTCRACGDLSRSDIE